MYEWHIGDPVDWGDGFMDAQNQSYGNDDNEDDFLPNKLEADKYSRKAWNLCNQCKYESALQNINLALSMDGLNAGNWNIKAIILDFMGRYGEAEKCYDQSLRLSPQNLVFDNKARMLRYWAGNLIEEAKKKPDGIPTLNEAWEINRRAIDTLPGDKSEENIEDYFSQRDTIDFYIDYENKYHNNVETVKGYVKSDLFTITGMQFYKNNISLSPGMELKLVREPYNKFDPDAVEVFVGSEKIGYVANNDYTKSALTSAASEIKDRINGVAHAEYVLYLERYVDIQFAIGRLI